MNEEMKFQVYPAQLGEPEVEDCSSMLAPDTTEPGEGKKKVIVPDPVSMTKFLFSNYRLTLYTYLNKCCRNGTLANLVGARIRNKVINHEICSFPDVKFWRIDREDFYADVSVELKLQTCRGPVTWNGVLALWCSFEEIFSLSFDSLVNSIDRKAGGYDPLSPFLVPYYTNKRMDEVSESIWVNYGIPEALHDPTARDALKLADKMGLKVKYHRIYDHRNVDGIIFFDEDDLIAGDDYYEYDDNGGKRLVRTSNPQRVRIPAGTIVINTNKVKEHFSRFYIFHECIHNEIHYLYFRLQQMGSNDPRKMKVKEIIVDKDADITDPVYFMEKQANRGGYGLMMPARYTRARIAGEGKKAKGCRHAGERYEIIGKTLSSEMGIPHFRLRARMIQLGYIQAKGSLNYVDKEMIQAFAFDVDSWRESQHTFVVSKETVDSLCYRNGDLRKLFDSGEYVYADGHVVRNDPIFVRKREGQLELTELANGHVDECCLRFVRLYRQENIGKYVYGQMYCDTDYLEQNKFYMEDLVNNRQLSEIEARRVYKREFPKRFKDAVAMLRKKNGFSISKMAEILSMDDSTFSRWVDDPKKYRNEDFLTMLCLIFKLPDWISRLLLKRANVQLDEDDDRHALLMEILRARSNDGIEAANEYLIKNKEPPLSLYGAS